MSEHSESATSLNSPAGAGSRASTAPQDHSQGQNMARQPVFPPGLPPQSTQGERVPAPTAQSTEPFGTCMLIQNLK